MAFASTVIGRTVMGNKRVHWGTFNSTAGDTGGDIDTELRHCDILIPIIRSSGGACTVDEDFSSGPLDGTAITITTGADEGGYWVAWGSGYKKS